MIEQNKQAFFSNLENIFVGAKIKDKKNASGFTNLLDIKNKYFTYVKKQIDKNFKEAFGVNEKGVKAQAEMYDKINTFLDSFVNDTGTVFFHKTEFFKNIYAPVYKNNQDVELFYKTRDLYYVKSEPIYTSLTLSEDNHTIKFDASSLQEKSTNVKDKLVFYLTKLQSKAKENTKEDKTKFNISIAVEYSSQASTLKDKFQQIELNETKLQALLKHLKDSKKNTANKVQPIDFEGSILKEEEFKKSIIAVINKYKKQTEIDYFIHQKAGSFLKEQFNLYLYQLLFKEDIANIWNVTRIKEIQIIQEQAYKIIKLIANFENELKKIWEKPKLVKNANYVITLSKIVEFGGAEGLQLVLNHEGITTQIAEWQELNFVEANFSLKEITNTSLNKTANKNNATTKDLLSSAKNNEEQNITDIQATKLAIEKKILAVLNKKYQHLPIDTKYFTNIKLKLLSYIENLDDNTNGLLIKSDNWQALNTIKNKYQAKIDLIYIDPPFNTGSDFAYKDGFQDSTWLTLMENRLSLSKDFLSDKGSFYLHLDHNANFLGRSLLNSIFSEQNYKNEVIWSYEWASTIKNRYANKHDVLFIYAKKSNSTIFNLDEVRIPYTDEQLKGYIKDDVGYYTLDKPTGKKWYANSKGQLPKDVFNIGIISRSAYERLDFHTQKPEALLERVIKASSNSDSIIMDYFSGSGTTVATAHKLGRKWLGVEMGEHFHTVIIPRMKQVLYYDKAGISKNCPNYTGGGIYKYYELEQYEETLANAHYILNENTDSEDITSICELQSEKMAYNGLTINYSNTTIDSEEKQDIDVKITLHNLYQHTSNLDIMESISNITGYKIYKILNEFEVVLINESNQEETININELTLTKYNYLVPYIYW